MPGVVGLIHCERANISISESIKKLMHLPSYCSKEINVGMGIRLGQVWRHKNFQGGEWYYDKVTKSGALINGTMMLSSPWPHRVNPKEVLEYYQQKGFSNWCDYEGAFVVVIVDFSLRKVFISNDRLGLLPLYYAQTTDMFCFAPEVKAVLTALRKVPKFSKEGLISFLAAGHCLGETTLFESVQFLKPSSRLTLNLDTFSLEKTQVWRLRYEPSKEFQDKNEAIDGLFEAIKEGHKLVLADNPDRFDLLLSGGLDSRGIIGVLDQLGQYPSRALSWGLRDDIANSDARIAHLMADEFKVPFHFKSYNSDDIPENAENWCYISELANDNLGWFSEGTSVLLDFYDVTSPFSLKGDQCFGFEGWCFNEYTARSVNFPCFLPLALHNIIKSDQVETFEEVYDQEISSLTHGCSFRNWTDFKDYIHIYGRINRFISSMGYYKELSTEIRRPFFANCVLDVVRKLPTKFRVNKILYIDMLKHHLPRTMFLPNKMVNSLPDWPYDVRTKPTLRNFFLGLCNLKEVENEALSEIIDPSFFVRLREEFFKGEVQAVPRNVSFLTRIKKKWRPVISSSSIGAHIKHVISPSVPKPPLGTFSILNRIALVHLISKQFSRLSL